MTRDKVRASLDYAQFSQRDEFTGTAHSTIYMPFDVYTDLGEPDTITVSIEPGDTLNRE